MLKFTTWDFPIAILLFVVATAAALLLTTLGTSNQLAQVPKISRLRMVARLAIVFGGLTFFCFLLDISVVVLMAVLVSFLALGWCLSEVTPISFWNPAIVILYVFQQYVLGFPDRDDWILPSPKSDTPEASGLLKQWIAYQGMTCTVIKPTGLAEIDGKCFDVISEMGNLIESETPIVVSSVKGNRLVIRAQQSSKSTGN
jgi:hypothetical protein